MADVYVRFGTMKSNKSIHVQTICFNYEQKGDNILLLKSAIDKKAGNKVSSRIGLEREVNYLLQSEDSVIDIMKVEKNNNIKIIVVDEAQFLTRKQVEELSMIAMYLNIPVICYALKDDFRKEAFPGSIALFEIADKIEFLKTICSEKDCDKKSYANARKVNGEFVYEGEQVVIDNDASVEYIPLCRNEFHTLVKKTKNPFL